MGTLRAGDFFGETALLEEQAAVRSASVHAGSEVKCLLLDKEKFKDLIGLLQVRVVFII